MSFNKVLETSQNVIGHLQGMLGSNNHWAPVEKEEHAGNGWAQLTFDKIGEVHKHIPSGDLYPVQTAREAAIKTGLVFFGARYYFGVNLISTVAHGAYSLGTSVFNDYQVFKECNEFTWVNFAKGQATKFDPRSVASSTWKRFAIDLAGFSLMPGFGFITPPVMEYFSIGWEPTGYVFPVANTLKWVAFAYAMYNPLITRVALNRFEQWRNGDVKPFSNRGVRDLNFSSAFSAFRKGSLTLAGLFGMQKIGNAKDLSIHNPALINDDDDDDSSVGELMEPSSSIKKQKKDQ